MRKLETLTTSELLTWIQQAKILASQGQVAERIPSLAVANSSWFAVQICYPSGESICAGDTACVFPFMSAIKPFSLLYLLEDLGVEKVFSWVGVEPSLDAFNSIEQLMADGGYPRNPMINSGAITIADKLPGNNASDRTQKFCQWLNQVAGCQLKLDEVTLASVRSAGSQTNRDITRYLAEAGYVNNSEIALDTYEQMCCLSGTVSDLACLGKILAFAGELVSAKHRQIVNALMLTCGLYEASFQYAVQIGLPMKSGISGTLLAIVPGKGAIACYSPPLDHVGNPVGAIAFVEVLSQHLQLSIFANS
ncbi:glutaminase A [Fischerella thermalis CCMEE 5205]|uniref:glutaminase n=1 Tax=Fischerella thermalis TaxID=372787 RepID=UPI000C7F7C24|nr:glutaminase A [Fischerella thermalis CCMEE 5205]